jgi:hypothetical protein
MPAAASSSTLVLQPQTDDGGRRYHHPQKQQQQQQRTMEANTASSATTSMNLLLEMASKEIEGMRKAKARHNKRHRSESSVPTSSSSSAAIIPPPLYHSIPPACLRLIQGMPGNQLCLDCRTARHPTWATVSYGALLCLQCSGHHRSLGVHVSCVRSLTMDEWSLEQLLAMLEGGNAQCEGFFARHALTPECLTTTTTTATKSSSSSSSCGSSTGSSSTSSGGSDEEDAGVSTAAAKSSATLSSSSKFTRQNVTRLRYKTKAALFYRQQMSLHVRRVLQAGPYRGREVSRQQLKQQHVSSSQQQEQEPISSQSSHK